MMNFACIRDCNRCPFVCNKNLNKGVTKQELPAAIVKSTIPEEKSEVSTVPDLIIPVEEYVKKENTTIQEVQNLPVLADFQYEIKDVTEKKGFLGLFKK